MGAIGDAFAALRKILVMETNLAHVEKDVEQLADEIRRVRDYAAAIDRRLTLIEGTIQGFNMAAGTRLLPKE